MSTKCKLFEFILVLVFDMDGENYIPKFRLPVEVKRRNFEINYIYYNYWLEGCVTCESILY